MRILESPNRLPYDFSDNENSSGENSRGNRHRSEDQNAFNIQENSPGLSS